ncbi:MULTISPECIES: alginate lyase family protein [unclassified Thioalkalivibrio]|uniref:alginate lyase family protein n=1 Tax=unclassified Thioalkalivibrio TaxID=2621013 RepID=UPI000373F6CC|nr:MULTISPECIES: alginate lyase family protein [unclassified Thioalkalivibrio]
MPTEAHPSGPAEQGGGFVSIEKAILLDVCLGVPLGYVWFRVPAAYEADVSLVKPDTCLFRGEQLAFMKDRYEAGDPEIGRAVDSLCEKADQLLERGPFSVTNKQGRPASGDPHDYHSLAKYWWPNPDTPDGLPFVREDGRINPDCYSDTYDFSELEAFAEAVLALALAAFLTGDRRYADQGARLLRAWCVDEETRQNPHFEYAQSVPGEKDGGWQGIIEARRLIYITESARLLEAAGGLAADDVHHIQKWFSELLQWMMESEFGKAAASRNNNIAFWCDLQRMVYADFCGKDDLATGIARDVSIPRLQEQMLEDGSLPAELERAYPQDYVAFTVMAMALISRVGEKHGLQLWEPQEADGHGFRVAHDWLRRVTRSHHLLENLWQPDGNALSGAAAADGGQTTPHWDGEQIARLEDLGVQLRSLAHIAQARGQQLATERKRAAEQTDATFRDIREAHVRERQGFQAQLDAATATGNRHAEQAEALEQQLADTRKELEQLRAEHKAALEETEASKLQELQDLQDAHEKEKRYLRAQIEAANTMWGHHGEQESELKHKLGELRNELNASRKECADARKALKNAQERLEEARTEHQQSIEAAEADKQRELQEYRDAHEREKHYLQAQIEAANTMWERNAEQENELKRQLRDARKQLTELRSRPPAPAEPGRQEPAEADSLQQEHERQLQYLQAQLDTANAMWGWYAARAGDAGPSADTVVAPSTVHNDAAPAGQGDAAAPRRAKPASAKQDAKQIARAKKDRRERARHYLEMVRYAEKLEKQYTALLSSRSWRTPGAGRVLHRRLKGLVGGRVPGHNQWPSRPDAMNAEYARLGRDELARRITEGDIQAIRRYALALEKKITALVNSTSWKVMAPVRIAGRAYRRVIMRRPADRTRLPKRPKRF